MTIQSELKLLATDLQKSKSVRSVEMNPTMTSATIAKLLREVADFAAKNAKSSRVVLVGFVKQ